MKTNVIRVDNESSVLFGSKIIICEGLRPKRIVLREEKAKFVVTLEYLDASIGIRTVDAGVGPMPELVFTHSCFDQGNYFDFNEVNGVSRETAKINAEKCFYDRSSKL